MHERKAKILSIFYAVIIVAAFAYVFDAFQETRYRTLRLESMEREARLQKVRDREEAERRAREPERFVPPAPITYPFY